MTEQTHAQLAFDAAVGSSVHDHDTTTEEIVARADAFKAWLDNNDKPTIIDDEEPEPQTVTMVSVDRLDPQTRLERRSAIATAFELGSAHVAFEVRQPPEVCAAAPMAWNPLPDDYADETECSSCGEPGAVINECLKSQRSCGHHCNHSWDSDECCWCGAVFGGDE